MKHLKLYENFINEEVLPSMNKIVKSITIYLQSQPGGNEGLRKKGDKYLDLDNNELTKNEVIKWYKFLIKTKELTKDGKLVEKETGSYPAPKFARKPAAGDKGYNYVAKQFGADPAPKKKKKNSGTEE